MGMTTTTARTSDITLAARITDALMDKFSVAARAAGSAPTNAEVRAAFERLFPANPR